MRAAWYERTGTAREVLVVGEMPDPVPGPGEVRVALKTSGVNPSDWKARMGSRPMLGPRIIPHSDGALTSSKHVRAPAAADVADKVAAVAGPAGNLLERDAAFDESGNCRIGVLAPQIALVSQLFCAGQQVRIDCRRPDRCTDVTHRAAHRLDERCAGVFHQMPAVGHLDGLWQRPAHGLAIAPAAITRHDLDPWMLRQPSLHGGRLSVRQQSHDPPSFQIADDCPVAMVPPERPVIDANDHQVIGRHHRTSADDPQQGIVADGQHEPLGKTCSWPAAECQAQMMDDALQPRCPACSW